MILISTVSTVATIASTSSATTSTVATAAGTSLGAQMSLVAVLSLIILLIVKELAGAYCLEAGVNGLVAPQLYRLDRVLSLAIVPLLYAFTVIVVVKVAQILNL